MSSLQRELELEHQLADSRARTDLLDFTVRTCHGYDASWHHARIATAVDALYDRCTVRQLLHRYGMTDKHIEQAAKREHEVTKLYCGMTNPDMLDKELHNLQVWVSPRSGKTEIISRRAPAYWLGRRPNASILACSYGSDLAEANNRDVQRIIDEDKYGAIFPATSLSGQNVRTVASGAYLRNADMFEVVGHKGFYKCAGTGGSITGRGVNPDGIGLIDDPIKSREEAESPTKRHKLGEWLMGPWAYRVEAGAKQVLLNTRWHGDDASGQTIAKAKKNPMARQWFCLVFPALLDCEPGPGDPRKFGDSLWPTRYPVSVLQEMRASSEYEFNSQHQQRPSAKEGAIIKSEWLRYYETAPSDIQEFHLSVDLAFKDRRDYCAFLVWGRKDANWYLLDCINKRMEFDESLRTIIAMYQRWPNLRYTLIEEAANGAAALNVLRKQIRGLLPIRPRTSKEIRLSACAPLFRAGNVILPSNAPWTDMYVTQLLNFPADAHDDLCDATSQLLNWANEQPHPVYTMGNLSLPRTSPAAWR